MPSPAAATAAAFGTATQLFLDQLKKFTDMTQAAGTTPWTDTAGRPGTELAREVLQHMRSMAEHTPAPTAHLDIFLLELRAKRALIGSGEGLPWSQAEGAAQRWRGGCFAGGWVAVSSARYPVSE